MSDACLKRCSVPPRPLVLVLVLDLLHQALSLFPRLSVLRDPSSSPLPHCISPRHPIHSYHPTHRNYTPTASPRLCSIHRYVNSARNRRRGLVHKRTSSRATIDNEVDPDSSATPPRTITTLIPCTRPKSLPSWPRDLVRFSHYGSPTQRVPSVAGMLLMRLSSCRR